MAGPLRSQAELGIISLQERNMALEAGQIVLHTMSVREVGHRCPENLVYGIWAGLVG
jgi:hypothetical protein